MRWIALGAAAALISCEGSAAVYSYTYVGQEMACATEFTCENGAAEIDAIEAVLVIDETLLGAPLAGSTIEWTTSFPSDVENRPDWLSFSANYGGIDEWHFLSSGRVVFDESLQIVSWTIWFARDYMPWDWGMDRWGDYVSTMLSYECTDFSSRCLHYHALPSEWSGPQFAAAPLPPALLPFALALGGIGWFVRRRRLPAATGQ